MGNREAPVQKNLFHVDKVLLQVFTGTEPIEASIPNDIFRHAGAGVTVASAGDTLLVDTMCSVTIVADVLLTDYAADNYDLIILPRARFSNVLRVTQGGVPGVTNLGGCVSLDQRASK
ncbi:protein DJ-1 homolog B-like [Aegilops tauschii subsp. strangulata]|uniref:protein DJ-1 homolog B-like n=1 Tax=Aegilops tauschii subsp. strangulata TaxID=200361 RepID=UPI003CC8847A